MTEQPPTSSEAPPNGARKIVHIDMDAFYASVEQRDDPSLRGRPVAVGGSRERGVVAAASYEARRFGVRSAMPSVTARRRCPDLVFVPPRFEVYRAISRQVRGILADYTDLIEPLSLDEAYLDVTETRHAIRSATRIAEDIRRRVREETGLTASAGVSYNKLLAKLASDHRKPDGLFVIPPGAGEGFVAALPVGRLHGIGPVTAARMNRLGILTGEDLKCRSRDFLAAEFGRAGEWYHLAARGIDHRPVSPDRRRKSIGSESTFAADLAEPEALAAALVPAVDQVWSHAAKIGLAGRTVTLKAKYSDFRTVTRRRTLDTPVPDREALARIGSALLGQILPAERGIRLLGLTLSNFVEPTASPAGDQLALL